MVYVDSREPKNIQFDLKNAFDVEVRYLGCGDIMAPTPKGICLIERKTPTDFLGSLGDGRLVSQSARMLVSCDAPVVVVHGDIKCDKRKLVVANGRRTRWSYWAFTSAVLSLQLAGLLVLIVPDRLYVDTVGKVIAWFSKDSHMTRRRVNVNLPTTRSMQIQFMSALPGIGSEMASRVLDKYGSPGDALSAIHHWHKIKGVGPKSVERVLHFMNWRPRNA